MFLLFPHPEAEKMVEMASGQHVEGPNITDEFALSTLKEIGNIMCGCYLNVFSTFLDKKIMHSVPQVSNDMLGAVMDSILVDLSLESDYAIVLETAFTFSQDECKGFLFFIPTSDSIETIFDAIKVD
jgi:chemotaxis protein CheC